jgi:hypothetical protein
MAGTTRSPSSHQTPGSMVGSWSPEKLHHGLPDHRSRGLEREGQLRWGRGRRQRPGPQHHQASLPDLDPQGAVVKPRGAGHQPQPIAFGLHQARPSDAPGGPPSRLFSVLVPPSPAPETHLHGGGPCVDHLALFQEKELRNRDPQLPCVTHQGVQMRQQRAWVVARGRRGNHERRDAGAFFTGPQPPPSPWPPTGVRTMAQRIHDIRDRTHRPSR